MPKPNYQYEKRQRELAKKQKKEEKARRKANPPATAPDAAPEGETGSADAPEIPDAAPAPAPQG